MPYFSRKHSIYQVKMSLLKSISSVIIQPLLYLILGDYMSKISTDDCKDFLMKTYPDSNRTKWKRVSKYKDDHGLVCRDFNNPTVGDVTLIEVNDTLELKQSVAVDVAPVTIKDNTIVVKSFSKKDMTDAKRLVSKYVNSDGEEEISDDNKGFIAIPSQVVYRFSMLDGDHKEILDSVNATRDYNHKMDRFCLEIYPAHGEYNEHMDYLIGSFMPENDGEAMECTYEFSYEEPISIKEMVQKMASAGFIYLEDSCFLAETVSQLEFMNEAINVESSSLVDVKSAFEQAIKTDDGDMLDEALSSGGLLNFKYKKAIPLVYCMQNNLVNCFKVLVKHEPNLAKGVKYSGNPVWAEAVSDVVLGHSFDYLAYLLEHGKYDFKKASPVENQMLMSVLVERNLLDTYRNILNDKVRSALTLHMMMDDPDPFSNPNIAQDIYDGMHKYAKYMNEVGYLGARFSMGIVSPPILDMMVEAKFRIYRESLEADLESQIELFKTGRRGDGFTKAQVDDAIARYTKAIEKLRKG
jgi:hypothetical protein